MDRRQFNKLVATSVPALVGASFLPLATAEPKKPNKPLEINYEPPKVMHPGQHIFAGLIDGKRTFVAHWFPWWPVSNWLWRINNYVASCEFGWRNWHDHEIDLLWTDHWWQPSGPVIDGTEGDDIPLYAGIAENEEKRINKHCNETSPVHKKIRPDWGLAFTCMKDKWGNLLFWEPNSHRDKSYGDKFNESPCLATLHLRAKVPSNDLPLGEFPGGHTFKFIAGFGISAEDQLNTMIPTQELKIRTINNVITKYSWKTHKMMPYPARIYTKDLPAGEYFANGLWSPTITGNSCFNIPAQRHVGKGIL